MPVEDGYIGTGPEAGIFVSKSDAYTYALERCLNGSKEDIEEFREIRKPREIPYLPIEGQMSLNDFPEVLPVVAAGCGQVSELSLTIPQVGVLYMEVEAESEEEAISAALEAEEISFLNMEDWGLCREVQVEDEVYKAQAVREG